MQLLVLLLLVFLDGFSSNHRILVRRASATAADQLQRQRNLSDSCLTFAGMRPKGTV